MIYIPRSIDSVGIIALQRIYWLKEDLKNIRELIVFIYRNLH